MSLETPVAFFIFKRPETTQQVFDVIKKIKPKKLLVIADGPKTYEERVKCQQARSIIEEVDWNCEIYKNYSQINLGCRQRVSSGIDWVFSKVEEAIILEDDCLPSESFFQFCSILLEKYRYDERIMMISGNNYPYAKLSDEASYCFSKYTLIWGWATWKRAWKYYDVSLKDWDDLSIQPVIKAMCNTSSEIKFRLQRFREVKTGKIDTWDSQWLYTCWSQNGLAILPKYNLVSNIGFGKNATNTKIDHKLSNLPINDIYNIKHPKFVFRNEQNDSNIFDYWFNGKYLKKQEQLHIKLKNNIKENIKKIFK